MRIIGRAVALPQSQRKQTPEIGAVPDGQSKWGILTLQQCGGLGETHSSQVVVSREPTGWRWGIGALCGPPRTGVAEGVSPTDADGVSPPHSGRELACPLPHSRSVHFRTESPVNSWEIAQTVLPCGSKSPAHGSPASAFTVAEPEVVTVVSSPNLALFTS